MRIAIGADGPRALELPAASSRFIEPLSPELIGGGWRDLVEWAEASRRRGIGPVQTMREVTADTAPVYERVQ